MAKHIDKWRCETCGCEYGNEIDAKNCENQHIKPIGIDRCVYSPNGKDPKAVVIKMPFDRELTFYVKE